MQGKTVPGRGHLLQPEIHWDISGGRLPRPCVPRKERDGLWGGSLCLTAEQGRHQAPALGFEFFPPFPPPWPGLHSLPALRPETSLHRQQLEITHRKGRPGHVSGAAAGSGDAWQDGEEVPVCRTKAAGVPQGGQGRHGNLLSTMALDLASRARGTRSRTRQLARAMGQPPRPCTAGLALP